MRQSRPPMVRMQYIDQQLRMNRYPNCSGIALYFEVSTKSIQRDVHYMRDMLGAPIAYNKQKRGFYYEKEWQFLPVASLERHEAEALMATKKVLSNYQGTPYFNEVSRALDKVLQYLPASVSEESLLDIYSFGNSSAATDSIAHFGTIEVAVRDHRKAIITYNAPSKKGEVTTRTIHPYRLHYSQSLATWYIISYCELRQEIRTFAVSRVLDVRLLEEHFSIPETFSIEEYLANAFEQVSGEEAQQVAIRFSPWQSRWIREHSWHPTQQIAEQPDGGLILTMQVSSLDAVKRWVMRYGGEAEVLVPEELRSMIREELLRMGGVYGSGSLGDSH